MDQLYQSWVSAPPSRPHTEAPSGLGIWKVSLGSDSAGPLQPGVGGGSPPPGGGGGGWVGPPPPCTATFPRIQSRNRSTRASTSLPPPAPELTATMRRGLVPGTSTGPPESPDSITSLAM